ncbi:hypothetical protein STEG23_004458, partial [Scotinomys teguina]
RLNKNKLQVLPELLFQSTPKLTRLEDKMARGLFYHLEAIDFLFPPALPAFAFSYTQYFFIMVSLNHLPGALVGTRNLFDRKKMEALKDTSPGFSDSTTNVLRNVRSCAASGMLPPNLGGFPGVTVVDFQAAVRKYPSKSGQRRPAGITFAVMRIEFFQFQLLNL